MEVKLEVVKGPEKNKVFTINEPTTCIAGRSEDARFRFSEDDPYISRAHFLLEIAPPNVFFRDLGTVTNPSKINDMYVEEAELSDGDIIEIGYTKLKVSLDVEIRTCTVKCRECEKPIQIFEDEKSIQICSDCAQKDKIERISLLHSRTPFKVNCSCGKDLTEIADSDGRAGELEGRVRYACKNCLPSKGKDAGKQINDYEVIKKIGEGGFGKVYLARHAPTCRLVALKEMNIANKQLGARFNREIRILGNLHHANILSYIDKGQEKRTNRPYLAMEYASNGNLDEMIYTGKSIKPSTIVQYIIQALKGLEYIHSQGVVHRDIKPENILLHDTGTGELVPKICDFGLAREFSKVGWSNLTGWNKMMGTRFYMPPEQIKNAHNVKEPADIYAMGISLYYLLTGKYPFHFPSPMEILKFYKENKHKVNSPEEAFQFMLKIETFKKPELLVLYEDPVPINQRKSSIPNELAEIVDRAIKKSINDRFESAGAFRKQLESIRSRL